MVKEPVGGRVKTRLTRQVGLSRALGFYRYTMAGVLARVGRDPRWQTLLAVAPDTALGSRGWPADLGRMPQRGGDLGQRMQRIFDRLPPGPAIVVGSDIPGITAATIAEAFRRLAGRDAVLGPAGDGGYWLIGLQRRPKILRPFASVRWSTAHALADTKANLAGASVAEVALLHDVDELADLERLDAIAARRVLPPHSHKSK